jgi:hypothetical protein
MLPPDGPLLFDAFESDDGGAEVLAESLIFCHAKRRVFFKAKLSTIKRSKSQPKKVRSAWWGEAPERLNVFAWACTV